MLFLNFLKLKLDIKIGSIAVFALIDWYWQIETTVTQ